MWMFKFLIIFYIPKRIYSIPLYGPNIIYSIIMWKKTAHSIIQFCFEGSELRLLKWCWFYVICLFQWCPIEIKIFEKPIGVYLRIFVTYVDGYAKLSLNHNSFKVKLFSIVNYFHSNIEVIKIGQSHEVIDISR